MNLALLSLFAFAAPVTTADVEATLLATSHRYEMLVVASTKVPVMGNVEGATRTLGISRFKRGAAGGLEHHFEVCDVIIEGDSSLFRTSVPDTFIRALKPKVGRVRVVNGAVEVDMGEEYLGFRETHAEKWPPAHRRSDGVTDSDDDGRPGATLDLQIAGLGRVKLLISQRAHSVLLGEATEAGLEGRVRMKRLEQRVIDTEPAFFKLNAKVTPLEDKSWFKLTPVVGEASCGAIFAKPSPAK